MSPNFLKAAIYLNVRHKRKRKFYFLASLPPCLGVRTYLQKKYGFHNSENGIYAFKVFYVNNMVLSTRNHYFILNRHVDIQMI